MVTFVSTILVGAVAGFMMEQQWGQQLVRWSRMQKMKMRVARRQGDNPLRSFFEQE
jgi:hypothetical protein